MKLRTAKIQTIKEYLISIDFSDGVNYYSETFKFKREADAREVLFGLEKAFLTPSSAEQVSILAALKLSDNAYAEVIRLIGFCGVVMRYSAILTIGDIYKVTVDPDEVKVLRNAN